MKLIDLISRFRKGETLSMFCSDLGLNEESETIEIYAQEPVCLQSELGFFAIEQTLGKIVFESDGIIYRNLMDMFYFLDVIDEAKGTDELSDLQLAQKILKYSTEDS